LSKEVSGWVGEYVAVELVREGEEKRERAILYEMMVGWMMSLSVS
jgi:hypothetical protein